MRVSTILRYVIGAIGVTWAAGRRARDGNPSEIHARQDTTDGDKALAQNTTSFPSQNHTEPSDDDFSYTIILSEANAYNDSDSDEKKGWVIPVSHQACTNWDLSVSEIRTVFQMTIDWSRGGGKVQPRTYHKEVFGISSLYLCNCKWDYWDRAPENEMNEFYERLVDMCGEGQSGWIFSKAWDKGYAVATKNYVLLWPTRKNLCPPRCNGKY
ncbi:hypothetical protein F5Y04DRAFT_186351 [Hypomontagnella monticulosa]|nr:hypothetical protein F5Y04DRAFT_186351 [Hypomontagnella monticulosa]